MKSMDLFWKALKDYYNNNSNKKFYLIDKNWNKFENDISRYFRDDIERFDTIEKTLFQNTKWNILDIWSATGYYFPYLSDNIENIKWVEISQDAIDIAYKMWYYVEKCDIMNDKLYWKYDTITLLWNNLSLWWDIKSTKKLIWILKNLLKKDWKILAIFKKEEDEKYFIWEFCVEYKKQLLEPFKWIRININYLDWILKEFWLNMKILSENDYWYCLEIKNN